MHSREKEQESDPHLVILLSPIIFLAHFTRTQQQKMNRWSHIQDIIDYNNNNKNHNNNYNNKKRKLNREVTQVQLCACVRGYVPVKQRKSDQEISWKRIGRWMKKTSERNK